MKIIRVSTENLVTVHDYPGGTTLEQTQSLAELIGNGCRLVEHVMPRRLYDKLKYSSCPTCEKGECISMLVDEEGLLKEEPIINPIGSYLYEVDKHGCPIVGNILFIGEYLTADGISFSGLSESNFNSLKGHLEQMANALKLEV